MCVLVLVSDPAPGVALAVAANRDEYLHRLSIGPNELAPGVFGGKDLEAGGTWLGVNKHGLVVAVTNRRMPPRLRTSPSRGKVCLGALQLQNIDEVQRFVTEQTASLRYPGFNLIAMQHGRGICLQFDGRIRPVRIDGGVHVVSSHRDMDDPNMPERKVVLSRLAGWAGMGMLEDRLRDILRDHEETDGWAVCKHGNGYGTVSSTLIVVPSGGLQGIRYLYSAGPSCRNAFQDVSPAAEKALS